MKQPEDENSPSQVVAIDSYRQQPRLPITFARQELDQLLRYYGKMVAAGEWRDYAIDHFKDMAVFSVFRRTSETPLFRIEKNPKNARKQGAYSVINAGGFVIKRGHELRQVLRVFDRKITLLGSKRG